MESCQQHHAVMNYYCITCKLRQAVPQVLLGREESAAANTAVTS